jgi:hypothetical protein
MKYLLDNQYAPTTFSWGFVDAPFTHTTDAFLSWSASINTRYGINEDVVRYNGTLTTMLDGLFPVCGPRTCQMLTETSSNWTAYFDNFLRGADPISAVSQLCTLLKCRGVAVKCIPHREPSGGTGTYGAIQFQLFASNETHFLNHSRGVSVAHDGIDRWVFDANGPVQPFEELLEYGARRVRDRFTPEMLERYCAALGIDLFNADFYGPNAVKIVNKGPYVSDLMQYSRREALFQLGLGQSSEQ